MQMLVKKGKIPFEFRKQRAARFGVLDRYAKDATGIRWFEINPGFMSFHVSNGKHLVVWSCAELGACYVCACRLCV